jgi:hypothetical protein
MRREAGAATPQASRSRFGLSEGRIEIRVMRSAAESGENEGFELSKRDTKWARSAAPQALPRRSAAESREN